MRHACVHAECVYADCVARSGCPGSDTGLRQCNPPPYEKHQTYDATLPPASSDPVKTITLHVQDKVTDIAPDVPVDLWTFDGSVPGPILHVNQSDTIKFTLVNNGSIQHSIDFHAAQTAWATSITSPSILARSCRLSGKRTIPAFSSITAARRPYSITLPTACMGGMSVSSPDFVSRSQRNMSWCKANSTRPKVLTVYIIPTARVGSSGKARLRGL